MSDLAPEPRRQLLLDVLFGMALTALALGTLRVALLSTWRGVGGTTLVLVVLAVWLWRRARPRPWMSVVLAALGILGIYVVDGPLTVPLIGVGILLLVLDHGVRAGLLSVIPLTVVSFLVLGLLVDRGWPNAVVQTVILAGVASFFVALAATLRRSEDDRRRLAAANVRLNTMMAAQKDLVLAEERARAAQELHDGLGHQLTIMAMNLELAQRLRGTDPDQAWAEVATSRQTAVDALTQMRLWVRALNPVPVGTLSGPDAFEAIAQSFRGTGLDVAVEVHDSGGPLPDDHALFCYRLAQEGLTNTLRHGRASSARLVIEHRADGTDIQLTDDGAGGPTDIRPGFGLRSLTERAETLGGRLTALGSEHGFRLAASLPGGAR